MLPVPNSPGRRYLGAVRYEVWADNLTSGEKKILHATGISGTSYTLPSDLGFGAYRFWVRGIDAGTWLRHGRMLQTLVAPMQVRL